MFLVRLKFPGAFPDQASAPWTAEAYTLCLTLETLLVDAALALEAFEVDRRRAAPASSRGDWEAKRARARETERALIAADPSLAGDSDRLRMEVDAAVTQENLANGVLPSSYVHRLPFVHARSFLFAIDMVLKVLDVAADTVGAPPSIRQIANDMSNALPSLRPVRNSAAHLEDRVRGLGRGGRPLALQPSTTGPIRSAGPVLLVENLHGTRILTTVADGSHAELDVSLATLTIANQAVQRFVDAMPWTGPPRIEPR